MPDYWGRDLPVNLGQNNFDKVRYEYFRDRQVAFEAFKSGVMNYHEEFTSRTWATSYDFGFPRGPRQARGHRSRRRRSTPSWYFNTRREMFKDRRIREAIGLAFDFEWTNQNIMFGLYRRLHSFENSDMKAVGPPGSESCACSSCSAARCRTRGLRRALRAAGLRRLRQRPQPPAPRRRSCARPAASRGTVLKLPDGKPFEIEFLDYQASLQPHTQPFPG